MPSILVTPPINKRGQHVIDNKLRIMDELQIARSQNERSIRVERSGAFHVPVLSITSEAYEEFKHRMHGTDIRLEDS